MGVYPVAGCYGTRCLTGLWSTQAEVEGIVPKVAWKWGRDGSIVNDPFGETDHTLLYVNLPVTWGSLDRDFVFPPFCRMALFREALVDTHEQIDQWLW